MEANSREGSSPDFQKVRALFAKALRHPIQEREECVRSEAAEDPALRDEVLGLLEADAQWRREHGSIDAVDAPAPSAEASSGDGDRVRWTATDELLQRLEKSHRFDSERFRVEKELGRGGMGVVHGIHDHFLNRRLAMKVLRDRRRARDEDERKLTHQLLARFLEEAQVTSQLDHPGVVPVHDIGMDAAGKVYFTMRMVKGRTANEVFADALAERDGWNLTTALEVVLKVCDTMAFAHDKRVLHRDLKPTNVMIGRFGEVYVMDWGLAKVLGQKDRHEHNLRPATRPAGSQLHTTREHDATKESGSSLVSMDGQRLGTPSYMSPEQARSQELDFRTDVYSIGAMLYELVTGRAPYTSPGVRMSPESILRELDDGPPKRIEQLRRTVPAELVAVIEKAMARERDERYPTVGALAKDLRAFLANRVVSAYRTGAWQETRLWVRRNKSLAASIAASFLALFTGVLVAVTFAAGEAEAKRKADIESESARKSEQLSRDSESRATQARLDADAKSKALSEKIRDFDYLSLAVDYDRLIKDSEALVPGYPDQTADLENWLERADRLMAKEPELRALVAKFSASGADAASIAPGGDRFVADALSGLLQKIPSFDTVVRKVRDRHRWSLAVGELTLNHPNSQWKWPDVRAKVAANPKYAGQSIPLADHDIWGLVPIGENPQSKLWEFYDLRSAWDGKGDPIQVASIIIPRHASDGRIEVRGETGIIWVLVPGGYLPKTLVQLDRFSDHHPQEHDRSNPPRDPRVEVRLDPMFVSKHEVTHGQWNRMAPEDAADLDTRSDPSSSKEASWWAFKDALEPLGMRLPSEMQWEYFARAGAATIWWTGNDSKEAAASDSKGNAFGLANLMTNLGEWCIDANETWAPYGTEREGDGRRPPPKRASADRVLRGYNSALPSRLSERISQSSYEVTHRTGARPVRPLSRRTEPHVSGEADMIIASGIIVNHSSHPNPSDITFRVKYASRHHEPPIMPTSYRLNPDNTFLITGRKGDYPLLLEAFNAEGFCPITPIQFRPGDRDLAIHVRRGAEVNMTTWRTTNSELCRAILSQIDTRSEKWGPERARASRFHLPNGFMRGRATEEVDFQWDSIPPGTYRIDLITDDGDIVHRTPPIHIAGESKTLHDSVFSFSEAGQPYVLIKLPQAATAPSYLNQCGESPSFLSPGFAVVSDPVHGNHRTIILTSFGSDSDVTFNVKSGSNVTVRMNGYRDAVLHDVRDSQSIHLNPGIETRIAISGHTTFPKAKILLTLEGVEDPVHDMRNTGLPNTKPPSLHDVLAHRLSQHMPRAWLNHDNDHNDDDSVMLLLPRPSRYRLSALLFLDEYAHEVYALSVEPTEISVPEEGGDFQIRLLGPR